MNKIQSSQSNSTKQTPTFLPNFLCSRSFLAFSDFSSIICFEISFFLIWIKEGKKKSFVSANMMGRRSNCAESLFMCLIKVHCLHILHIMKESYKSSVSSSSKMLEHIFWKQCISDIKPVHNSVYEMIKNRTEKKAVGLSAQLSFFICNLLWFKSFELFLLCHLIRDRNGSPSACAGLTWPSLQSNHQASLWQCRACSREAEPLGLKPELDGSCKLKQNVKDL